MTILIFKNIIPVILLSLLLSCNNTGTKSEKTQNKIEAVIVTAKYCYTSYKEHDKNGINIYFAGRIINNTPDTIYILNKELKSYKPFDLEKSLFYTVINNDSLFFYSYWGNSILKPRNSVKINLQYYIRPTDKKLIDIFKNIATDQQMLDTIKIHYATPQSKLNILPPITFDHSPKFRIDTVPYNSYFEGIFVLQDYYEKPVKISEPISP